jgi:hypothetical protein
VCSLNSTVRVERVKCFLLNDELENGHQRVDGGVHLSAPIEQHEQGLHRKHIFELRLNAVEVEVQAEQPHNHTQRVQRLRVVLKN